MGRLKKKQLAPFSAILVVLLSIGLGFPSFHLHPHESGQQISASSHAPVCALCQLAQTHNAMALGAAVKVPTSAWPLIANNAYSNPFISILGAGAFQSRAPPRA